MTFRSELHKALPHTIYDLRKEENALSRTSFARGPSRRNEGERARRCEEILMIQAMGLKKRISDARAKSAVVGISGGLDSTLALLVTAKAFDALGMERKDIVAVTMPCFGTTDSTYQNACRCPKSLELL